MEALGINPGFLLIQIVNLIIAYVVITKWIVSPILGLLEKRRQTVAQGLEDARVAAEARANAEKDAAKIIAEAQAEASRIVSEATARAEAAGKDVKAAMEAEAAKARDAALAEAELERNRILADLRGQVAALAIAAANKLVREALDEKKQRALIDEFFSGVKGGKVILADGGEFKGETAEVTSALPLTKEEEEAVKRSFGVKEVSFKVNPNILGGLVLKIGDKALDASVAGKLEGLRQTLK